MGAYQIPSSIIFENKIFAGVLNSTETDIDFIQLLESSENEGFVYFQRTANLKKEKIDLFFNSYHANNVPFLFPLKTPKNTKEH